jgi:hypothetical protein
MPGLGARFGGYAIGNVGPAPGASAPRITRRRQHRSGAPAISAASAAAARIRRELLLGCPFPRTSTVAGIARVMSPRVPVRRDFAPAR